MTDNAGTPFSGKESVALIGLRGSGKTTIARELATVLSTDMADTDVLITQAAHRSIAEIFDEGGESGFRRRERQIVQRLTQKPPGVISVGGGAVLDPHNVADLKRVAIVVWLQASIDELAHRIQTDPQTDATRPALTPHDLRDELAALLQARELAYTQAADLIVDTTHKTPAQVTTEILRRLPGPASA